MPLNTPIQPSPTHPISGLAKAIFDTMSAVLEPPPSNMTPEDAARLHNAREQLSHAIAAGVVAALKGEMSASPDCAQSYSSGALDAAFWNWLAGFVKIFLDWAPTTSEGKSLHDGLQNFVNENAVPTELKGIIR